MWGPTRITRMPMKPNHPLCDGRQIRFYRTANHVSELDNVVDNRAGTSDYPFQNHAQVWLRVHSFFPYIASHWFLFTGQVRYHQNASH